MAVSGGPAVCWLPSLLMTPTRSKPRYQVRDAAELKILVIGEKLETVRSTVDDLLACLAAAESSLDVSDS